MYVQQPENFLIFGALMDNPHLDKCAQRQRVEDLVAGVEQQPPVGTRVLLEYLYDEYTRGKPGP